jgi:sugar lactone lactonase YvrE
MNWQAVTKEPNELGESPFWHPHEQQLYWVDIPGKNILRCNVFTGQVQTWPMPSEPGCIAPAAKGGLVIALRDGMYRAQTWGGDLQKIAAFQHNTATTRFNDGKCDTLGRFWAGTMFEPRTQAAAELFCLDARSGKPVVERKAGNATIANGLAWSPSNDRLYWTDTTSQTIRCWAWNAASNSMQDERIFKQFPLKPAGWTPVWPDPHGYAGRPDGAAVDVQGNYWVAMFEGQCVLQIAPSGEVLQSIATPARCPTMPCFGGDDLKTLYITTARHARAADELAAFPQSGCVFSLRVDVSGLPVNFFVD